jgi:hypothetical protein
VARRAWERPAAPVPHRAHVVVSYEGRASGTTKNNCGNIYVEWRYEKRCNCYSEVGQDHF